MNNGKIFIPGEKAYAKWVNTTPPVEQAKEQIEAKSQSPTAEWYNDMVILRDNVVSYISLAALYAEAVKRGKIVEQAEDEVTDKPVIDRLCEQCGGSHITTDGSGFFCKECNEVVWTKPLLAVNPTPPVAPDWHKGVALIAANNEIKRLKRELLQQQTQPLAPALAEANAEIERLKGELEFKSKAWKVAYGLMENENAELKGELATQENNLNGD